MSRSWTPAMALRRFTSGKPREGGRAPPVVAWAWWLQAATRRMRRDIPVEAGRGGCLRGEGTLVRLRGIMARKKVKSALAHFFVRFSRARVLPTSL